MRYAIIAIMGAAVGVSSIALGFNFRIGGFQPWILLSGPEAYLPAAIAGALAALTIGKVARF